MPRSYRARRLANLLAGGVLALGVHSRAAVLCVGSGGHVAIEQAHAGCCDREQTDTTSTLLSHENHCADVCTDVPLGVSATCGRSERASSPSVVLGPSSAGPLGSGGPGGRLLTCPQAGFAPNAPPRTLRTTVNLC